MKTLIVNATIVPMTSEDHIFLGSIAVDGRTIIGIGDIPDNFHPDRTIDAEGMIALPGLVNAHTHLSMTYFRNYRDSVADLHDWLKEVWKLEDTLVEEDTYPASLLGIAEMIFSGTTCFADMYFFPEGTCRAVVESKIKANIGLTLFGGIEDSRTRISQRLPILQEISRQSAGLINYDIAPHAVYTCTAETYRLAIETARTNGCRLHTHASETLKEVEDCIRDHGLPPIAYLETLGLSTVNSYLAHCVHPTETEYEVLADLNTSVVHNPSSNCKLASGIAPIPSFATHSIALALGTDGASSNNSLDLFQEIRLAAMLSSVDTGNPVAISPFEILRMATYGGAKALGRYYSTRRKECPYDSVEQHFQRVGLFSEIIRRADGALRRAITYGKPRIADHRPTAYTGPRQWGLVRNPEQSRLAFCGGTHGRNFHYP
jgi:5-methylthioadenosine/S-adenosylhomocysteine deaminase